MSELEIKAKLDTKELDAELVKVKRRLKTLNNEIIKQKAEIRKMGVRAVAVANATVAMARIFVKALPEGMQAAAQAGIDVVYSTIFLLSEIAAAYTAGGVTAPLAIGVAAGAVMLSTIGLAAALTAQDDVNRAASQMEASFRSMSMQLGTMERSLGGW